MLVIPFNYLSEFRFRQTGFALAGLKALTTLAFVSPETVLPRVMDQLRVDINLDILNSLTETDYAIWKTPEGTTYVDGRSYYLCFKAL